jgi:branched-chain amino acid transport system permease protein
MRGTFTRYLPVLALAAASVLVQLVLSALKLEYWLTQLTMAAYTTLAALGLSLLMGYAGQVSMGHAGFVAIGGYSSAVLTTLNILPMAASPFVAFLVKVGLAASGADIYGAPVMRVSPWLAFAAAVVIAAIVALTIGVPVLRLHGHYLAMATLGFGFIVSRVLLGTRILGEADGISDIPAFSLFAGLVVTGKRALRVQNYYIAWALVAVGVLLVVNLINSRAGRALRAVHGNEEAAAAVGVDVARFKLAAFVMSAIYAAVAGACLAHFNGGIGPAEAGIMKSVRYVALVAAGGMGNVWGTLAVSALLTFLSLRGVFGLYDDAFFGAVLVAVMLFAPQGMFRIFGALKGSIAVVTRWKTRAGR